MSDAIETVYSMDRKRRLVIFRRPDGLFAYREEYHYVNDYDKGNVFEGWAKFPPGKSYFDNIETARREAVSRAPWPVSSD
jgi:hypothetical protein